MAFVAQHVQAKCTAPRQNREGQCIAETDNTKLCGGYAEKSQGLDCPPSKKFCCPTEWFQLSSYPVKTAAPQPITPPATPKPAPAAPAVTRCKTFDYMDGFCIDETDNKSKCNGKGRGPFTVATCGLKKLCCPDAAVATPKFPMNPKDNIVTSSFHRCQLLADPRSTGQCVAFKRTPTHCSSSTGSFAWPTGDFPCPRPNEMCCRDDVIAKVLPAVAKDATSGVGAPCMGTMEGELGACMSVMDKAKCKGKVLPWTYNTFQICNHQGLFCCTGAKPYGPRAEANGLAGADPNEKVTVCEIPQAAFLESSLSAAGPSARDDAAVDAYVSAEQMEQLLADEPVELVALEVQHDVEMQAPPKTSTGSKPSKPAITGLACHSFSKQTLARNNVNLGRTKDSTGKSTTPLFKSNVLGNLNKHITKRRAERAAKKTPPKKF